MEIKIINTEFSICKIRNLKDVDLTDEIYFIGKTEEELSLVCSSRAVPKKIICREDGWKGFRVQGQLEFSLVGILADISSLLAKNKISIFAVSTYNTDYILTKENYFNDAIKILQDNGYILVE